MSHVVRVQVSVFPTNRPFLRVTSMSVCLQEVSVNMTKSVCRRFPHELHASWSKLSTERRGCVDAQATLSFCWTQIFFLNGFVMLWQSQTGFIQNLHCPHE